MIFKIILWLISSLSMIGTIGSDDIIIRTLCFTILVLSVIVEVQVLNIKELIKNNGSVAQE